MSENDTTTVYVSITGLIHTHPRCGTARYRTVKTERTADQIATAKKCSKCFKVEAEEARS